MDAFPSAFERFEEDMVDVSRFRDYAQLRRAFQRWAGFRWIDSMAQERALRREALRRGIPFREGISFAKQLERATVEAPAHRPIITRRAERDG